MFLVSSGTQDASSIYLRDGNKRTRIGALAGAHETAIRLLFRIIRIAIGIMLLILFVLAVPEIEAINDSAAGNLRAKSFA